MCVPSESTHSGQIDTMLESVPHPEYHQLFMEQHPEYQLTTTTTVMMVMMVVVASSSTMTTTKMMMVVELLVMMMLLQIRKVLMTR